MAQNFLSCDRDQPMLLPPELRDWLSDDHLAWFVIDAVAELDLEPFYASYRADGHGAAAHDPKMMVTLFAYAYAVGERSSRGIERRCREDVAFRGDLPGAGAWLERILAEAGIESPVPTERVATIVAALANGFGGTRDDGDRNGPALARTRLRCRGARRQGFGNQIGGAQ